MLDDWLECSLADACRSIDYGLTASAANHEAGPKLLRITDIVTGHIDWTTVPHVSADDETIAKYQLHDGDIVLARTGASTGASAYVKSPPPAVFASYLVRLQAKPDFDPRFLAYYLRSDDFWSFIRGVLGDKSAQPNASASTMTKAPLRAPRAKAEQRAIAHILGTLDDKIEVNRRMSETLEAMARSLFKSWFVDFDPIRAKLEGCDPGLPNDIAGLFPDRLVESELGEIPKGWDVDSIMGHAELLSGGTPKTDVAEYWNGNIPWASAKDVSQCRDAFLLTTERHITQRGLDESSTQMIPPLSTVVVARGATTGRLTMAGNAMAMNQTCYALRSLYGAPFYLYCSARVFIDRMVHAAHGSVFDTITTKTFQSTKVVLAPELTQLAFDAQVERIFMRLRAGLRESETLTKLRDSLLPKLVSGEIRAAS